MSEFETRGGRRTALGCLIIIILLLSCSGIGTFALDNLCYSALSQRIPIYPGAEIVENRYNILRAYGMGETFIVLHSDDDPNTVRRWYGETTGPYMRAAAISGDVAFLMTSSQWDVRRAPEGDGSEVRLLGSCLQA